MRKRAKGSVISRKRLFLLIALMLLSMMLVFVGACSDDDDDDDDNNFDPDTTTPVSQQLTPEEQGYLTAQELNEIDTDSSEELTEKGITLINGQSNDSILKSKAYFKAADLKNPSDTTKFFRAMTAVAAPPFDAAADPNPEDGVENIEDVGDILDRFGGSAEGRDLWGETDIAFPDTMPETAPTGAELQNFLSNYTLSDLNEGLASANAVSETFNTTWTLPTTPDDNGTPLDSRANTADDVAESDYGDVLLMKAAINGAMGMIHILEAYHLNVDLNAENVESFLASDELFLTIQQDSYLASAKASLIEAADNLLAAINWMEQETDDQTDDLITLADITAQELADAKTLIGDIKQSMMNDETPVTWEGTVAYISPFFEGLNLRSFLPRSQGAEGPSFVGNDAQGTFPDPTFGGILDMVDNQEPINVLNEDLNNNGTSDVLE